MSNDRIELIELLARWRKVFFVDGEVQIKCSHQPTLDAITQLLKETAAVAPYDAGLNDPNYNESCGAI